MDVTSEAFFRFSREIPGGVLCPNLEQLDWEIAIARTPPFFHIFLSPNLKRFRFCTYFVPEQPPQVAIELISRLPSSLEHFLLRCNQSNRDGEPLKDTISSLVLRCGSLRSFGCRPPLSETALRHLMQLPNLRSWVVFHEPPRTFSLSTFPPLEELHLEHAALPWFHLLVAHGEERHRNRPAPPPAIMNTDVKETLKVLTLPKGTTVDSVLLSSMSSFRNLVSVHVKNYDCPSNCLFNLTDNDVENFAATLPSLVDLRLGRVHQSAICRTTVSSLLSLSTHCLGLTSLEIHFGTYRIIRDMKLLLNKWSGRGKPRCKLRSLSVGSLLLPRASNDECETLAMGFADIFPCLRDFVNHINVYTWKGVERRLRHRLTHGS